MPRRAAIRVCLAVIVTAIAASAVAIACLWAQRMPRRPMPRLGTPDAIAGRWDAAKQRLDAAPRDALDAVVLHGVDAGAVPPSVRNALSQLAPSIEEAIAISGDPTPCWWSGGGPGADSAAHPLRALRPFVRVLSVEAKRRALDGDSRGAAEAIAAIVRIARTGECVAMMSAIHAAATLARVEQLVEWSLDRGALDAGAAAQIVATLEATAPDEFANPRAMLDGELAILDHTAALLPDVDLDLLGGAMPLLGIEVPSTRRAFLAEVERSEEGVRALRPALELSDQAARRSALRAAAESTNVKTFSGVTIRAAARASAIAEEISAQRDRLIDVLRPIARGEREPASMMNAGVPIWAAVGLVDTMARDERDTLAAAARSAGVGEGVAPEAPEATERASAVALAALAKLEPALLAHVAHAKALPRCDLRGPAARGANELPLLKVAYASGEGMNAKVDDGLLELRRLLDVLFGGARLALKAGDVRRAAELATAGVDVAALVAPTTLDASLAAQASFEEAAPLIALLAKQSGRSDADGALESAITTKADPFGRAAIIARLRAELASMLARRSTSVAAAERLVAAIERMPVDELAGLALAAHLAEDSTFMLIGEEFGRGASAQRRRDFLAALRGMVEDTTAAASDEDAGVALRAWTSQFDADPAAPTNASQPPIWTLRVTEANRRAADALR